LSAYSDVTETRQIAYNLSVETKDDQEIPLSLSSMWLVSAKKHYQFSAA